MDLNQLAGIIHDARVTELSHVLEKDIPGWPTHAHYLLNPWEKKAWGSAANNFVITMGEHNGTHLDASFHFYDKSEGGKSMEEYPAQKFMGKCTRMDMTHIAPDALVYKRDITKWEDQYGPVERDDIVLICFGWGKYFKPLPEGKKYTERWPGLSEEGAVYLAEKQIKMAGVDTFAIDASFSKNNEAHKALLPKDILVVECLANLEQIPERAYFIGLPLRIDGGSGSPVRAVAIW
jgi:kynurenine formamidase